MNGSAERIAVVGGGAMASAILEGAVRAGDEAARFVVAEPDAGRRGALAGRGFGVVERAEALPALDAGGWQVLLAVKPQVLPAVGASLAERSFGGVVVSILAGARSEAVRAALGGACRVIRVMPNLPAQFGAGMTAVALGAGAREGDDALATRLFGSVGEVVALDEGLMDAFTGVAGSGPAYLFYLAQAMERGAQEAGIDAASARRIVVQTLRGAAKMLAETGDDPGELRARVTSPGGTTQAATELLDERGVMEAVASAVLAARDRGAELGSG